MDPVREAVYYSPWLSVAVGTSPVSAGDVSFTFYTSVTSPSFLFDIYFKEAWSILTPSYVLLFPEKPPRLSILF